jgi:serine/threonine protein kinase
LEKQQGNSMEEYIEEHRELILEKDVQVYARQIGNALEYLHSNGILLRNLEAKSIIMTDFTIKKA